MSVKIKCKDNTQSVLCERQTEKFKRQYPYWSEEIEREIDSLKSWIYKKIGMTMMIERNKEFSTISNNMQCYGNSTTSKCELNCRHLFAIMKFHFVIFRFSFILNSNDVRDKWRKMKIAMQVGRIEFIWLLWNFFRFQVFFVLLLNSS